MYRSRKRKQVTDETLITAALEVREFVEAQPPEQMLETRAVLAKIMAKYALPEDQA